jgi:hypothetical protein
MGSGLNALENAVINHLFGGASLAQPTYHVGLFDAVTDLEAGTITEITGTGYARKSSASDFAWTRSNNTAENNAAISWTNSSGGAWTIEGIGIWTALTGGTLHWGHTFSAVTVNNGEGVEIAAGALDISIE